MSILNSFIYLEYPSFSVYFEIIFEYSREYLEFLHGASSAQRHVSERVEWEAPVTGDDGLDDVPGA